MRNNIRASTDNVTDVVIVANTIDILKTLLDAFLPFTRLSGRLHSCYIANSIQNHKIFHVPSQKRVLMGEFLIFLLAVKRKSIPYKLSNRKAKFCIVRMAHLCPNLPRHAQGKPNEQQLNLRPTRIFTV